MTSQTTASDPTSGGGERVKDAASDLIDQAGRTADAKASRTMTQAGDTLHQVASAVRGAGSDLSGERPEFANVATTVADQVDRAASYLEQHDASEALDSATDFARRQPVLVIGGALLAGLAIGRFLRSTADSQSGQYGMSSRSRLGADTAAGMRYAYGNSYSSDYGSDYASDYNAGRTERMRSSSSDFENRTSELEGTSSAASGAGSSGSSSTRKRSGSTGSRSSSTSGSRRSSTSSGSDSSSNTASSRGS